MVRLLNEHPKNSYRVSGVSEESLNKKIKQYCLEISNCRNRLLINKNELVADLESLTIDELELLYKDVLDKNLHIQRALAIQASQLNAATYKDEIAYYYALTWELGLTLSNNRPQTNDSAVSREFMYEHIINIFLFDKVFQMTTPRIFTALTLDIGFERYMRKFY